MFRQARERLEGLAHKDEKNVRLRYYTSYLVARMGDRLRQNGDLNAALQAYQIGRAHV